MSQTVPLAARAYIRGGETPKKRKFQHDAVSAETQLQKPLRFKTAPAQIPTISKTGGFMAEKKCCGTKGRHKLIKPFPKALCSPA